MNRTNLSFWRYTIKKYNVNTPPLLKYLHFITIGIFPFFRLIESYTLHCASGLFQYMFVSITAIIFYTKKVIHDLQIVINKLSTTQITHKTKHNINNCSIFIHITITYYRYNLTTFYSNLCWYTVQPLAVVHIFTWHFAFKHFSLFLS